MKKVIILYQWFRGGCVSGARFPAFATNFNGFDMQILQPDH